MYKVKDAKRTEQKRLCVSMQAKVTIVALLLVLGVSVGGTLAYLADQSQEVVNTFGPSKVTCEVKEDFNEGDVIDNVKRNVSVKNTGDIDAYVRIKLISYRVNKDGQTIGGNAEIPAFTPGEGWFKQGDHYYYEDPVAPGKTPPVPLIGGIAQENETDNGIALEDYHFQFYGETVSEEEKIENSEAEPYGIKSGAMGGGYQVIEVIAEAIQAEGIDSVTKKPAVTEAWGVTVKDGKLSAN